MSTDWAVLGSYQNQPLWRFVFSASSGRLLFCRLSQRAICFLRDFFVFRGIGRASLSGKRDKPILQISDHL